MAINSSMHVVSPFNYVQFLALSMLSAVVLVIVYGMYERLLVLKYMLQEAFSADNM